VIPIVASRLLASMDARRPSDLRPRAVGRT